MKMITDTQYGYIPESFKAHKFQYILYDTEDKPITAMDSLHILTEIANKCHIPVYVEEVRTSEIVSCNKLFLDSNTDYCVIFKTVTDGTRYEYLNIECGIDMDKQMFGNWEYVFNNVYHLHNTEQDTFPLRNYAISYVGEDNKPHHFYLLNQTNPINTTDVTQYIKFAFLESTVESLNIEEFKSGEYVLCFIVQNTDDNVITYEKVCNKDNMFTHISEFLTQYPQGTFECEHYSSFEEEWKQESINYSAFTSIPECCRTCMYVEFPYYWSDRDETSMFCVLHASKITEDLIHNCEELHY